MQTDRADSYDDFWDLYPAWVATAPPTTVHGRDWYASLYAEVDGPVCELGVGDGRIAIPAAEQGARVLGVDGSPKMLERMMGAAEQAGVAARITPIEADMRDFRLPEPVSLVTIPFHSIGHMVTLDDKLDCMRAVKAALAPGGRFVWDHFVFDPAHGRMAALQRYRGRYTSPLTGREGVMFASTALDFAAQRMDVLVRSDEMDERGMVVESRYRNLDYSWIEPDQARELMERAGFEVEAAYGDFGSTPLDESSKHQVWIGRV